MASVKQGTRTPPREFWKHMDWMKRVYWKGERKAFKREIEDEMRQDDVPVDPSPQEHKSE